jgi:hypothetical protein
MTFPRDRYKANTCQFSPGPGSDIEDPGIIVVVSAVGTAKADKILVLVLEKAISKVSIHINSVIICDANMAGTRWRDNAVSGKIFLPRGFCDFDCETLAFEKIIRNVERTSIQIECPQIIEEFASNLPTKDKEACANHRGGMAISSNGSTAGCRDLCPLACP